MHECIPMYIIFLKTNWNFFMESNWQCWEPLSWSACLLVFFFFMSSVSCLITLILKLPPSTDTKMVSPSSLETDSFDCGLSWLSLSADIKKLLHTYHYLQWHEKSQEVMSYEEDSSDVCFIHCFILEPSTVSSDSRHTITNEWTDG